MDKEKMKTEIETLRSSNIAYPHGFSTRKGGVSEGIYSSLNLGMSRGDDAEKVKENYRLFLNSCGIKEERFVCGKQVHGNKVLIVGAKDARKPYGYDKLFEADGYVTAENNVPLVIFTADCIPLLLADEKAGVVGAIHSGWRGTVADIEKNAIEAMEQLGAKRENICACISPAICKNCFEVGKEVTGAAEQLLSGKAKDLYKAKTNGKYLLDLKGVLKRAMINSGIPESNIEILQDCTMCMPEKYWSHRFTSGVRGSQAAVIMKD